MKKVLYIFLISIFSLIFISCGSTSDSLSSTNSDDSSSDSDDNDDSDSASSNTLTISSFVIDTTLTGGTISGSALSQSNNSALSGVTVSYAKSGSTIVNSTTDVSGDFSQSLVLGTYNLSYSKSGYLDEIQSATISDNQTLIVSTLKMLQDSCTSGTISGTIKDAVSNNAVNGVSLSARRGLNMTNGTVTVSDTTSSTGTYSFSSMSAGWYTVETSISGYITSTFHVYACGDQSDQDAFISTTLDPGAMRIVLSWKTDTDDLDSHVTAPDNLSGQGHSNAVNQKFHTYWEYKSFYYATNNFSCSGCSTDQLGDNVTLDLDNTKGIGSCNSCGPETLTISAVRDGTYSYYVHNFDEAGNNNLLLAASEATVTVYYNDSVTTFNVPYGAADLWYVFDFDNSSGFTAVNTMGSDSSFTADVFAPTLTEVTAVTTPTNDTTPNYTFSSIEAGTITYGGSCSSSSDTSADTDNNTVTFNTLSEGTYSDCTISVTDSAGNTSDNLSVSTFTVDTTGPTLSEVTAITTPSNDNTSSYTFSSDDSGTITYGGSCSSSNSSASSGNNTITFNALADGSYSNCTIIVTDNASNASNTLTVSTFVIDTTGPTLSEVTAVSTPSDTSTPSYTFSSNEAGTITYGGSCSSSTSSASASNNAITFTALDDGTYSDCTIIVTDSSGNASSTLSVTSFTVAVPPVLAEVTAVSTPTGDPTPDYTFSSNEAGTISYGGACGSSSSSLAISGNNTVTLTQSDNSTVLSDGTYDNCTIAVTDNNSNTSDNLTLSSFTVGASKPALAQVTAVTTPTNDSTPDYTFYSTLSGTINYSGSCSSSDTSADADNNTVTFNALSDDNYSDCKISVTATSSGLTSDNLSVDNFTIDTAAPSVSSFTMSDTAIKAGETATVQLVFSEAVISFSSSADITAPNGSFSTTMTSSDNITWSGTFTPSTNTEDSSNALSLATSYTDTAGNSGPAATTLNYEVETLAPSVNTFTMSDTALKIGDNATVQLVFSEAVISFSSSDDITAPNGTLDNLTSSDNITWTGTFTPTNSSEDSSNTLSLATSYTDTAGNSGPAATTSNYAVDTKAPSLSETTAVSTPTNNNTPSYTFSSNEAGTITYGGSCSSSTSSASASNNAITFTALDDGTYSDCTIIVTDSSGNASSTLSVTSFTVAVPPVLAEVTAVSTPTTDSTPDYTFSSTEAGTISYGGACGSSSSSLAISGNNTVTLTQSDNSTVLSDGTYDNCTIAVTDNNSNTSNNLSLSSFTIGASTPALSQVTAVTTPTNDSTPDYTFYSTLSGTINYSGSCSSSDTSADADNNTVTFNALSDDNYSDCKISVTATSSGLTSDNLSVDNFTIDTTAPSLSQVTAVTSLTNDSTPDYTFSSDEAGTITYGGSCSSSDTSADADNNTVTFNVLSDGSYSDCTVLVTDNASNASTALSVTQFVIDTTAPTVAEVSAVTTPSNDNTSSYTFSSTQAGDITYGGSCSSSTSSASTNNNAITFNVLPDGTYSDCTIIVTDNASNASNTLSVSSFVIDTTAPTLSEVTAVSTPTNDTTPNYTFYSNEAGTITYGGSCSSSDTSADADNNTVTFSSMSVGSYSDCTISVSDSSSNASNTLSVSSFTIETTAPTVTSTSPTDNQSSVAVSDNISVTFSESMDNSTVTANSSNTSCSGTIQLSSDDFSSCVQMSSLSPESSDNVTFTLDPSLTLLYSTTYKIRITTSVSDLAGNTMSSQYSQTYGFTTTDTIPITAGFAHSCFMLDNGSVKCWGNNAYGQLGLGDSDNRGDNSSEMGDNLNIIELGTGKTARTIEAGYNHTCAILDNASVKCWGSNSSGQLGLGDTDNRGDNSSEMGDNLNVVDLGTGRTALSIATGDSHTCTILDTSAVKCWGVNSSGQLGLGDTSSRGDGSSEMGDNLNAVDLGTGRTASAISAGDSHTCALLDNSAVKCWGDNTYGQLGQGDNNNRGDGSNEMGDNLAVIELGTGRTAKSLTTGTGYACAVLDDDSVKCWGRGNVGQLGHGKTTSVDSPPNSSIELGTSRTAKLVAAGNSQTCAMLDNSSIKCWGLNDSGQLGLGDTSNRGDGSNEMDDNLPTVDLGSGITARAISAGDSHTCAVLDNSSIKCWGLNDSGQLGLGDNNTRGDASGEMGDNLPSLSL